MSITAIVIVMSVIAIVIISSSSNIVVMLCFESRISSVWPCFSGGRLFRKRKANKPLILNSY